MAPFRAMFLCNCCAPWAQRAPRGSACSSGCDGGQVRAALPAPSSQHRSCGLLARLTPVPCLGWSLHPGSCGVCACELPRFLGVREGVK